MGTTKMMEENVGEMGMMKRETAEDATTTSMMVKTMGMAKSMEEKGGEMRMVGEMAEDAMTGEAVVIAGGKRSGLEVAEQRVQGAKKDVSSTLFLRWWKLAGASWIPI
jgi:hypothetical protein